MKMTLVTDAGGDLIGAVYGHAMSAKANGVEAHVAFAAGHKLHKVEVEDDLDKLTDPDEFLGRLRKHVPRA